MDDLFGKMFMGIAMHSITEAFRTIMWGFHHNGLEKTMEDLNKIFTKEEIDRFEQMCGNTKNDMSPEIIYDALVNGISEEVKLRRK